MTRFYLSFLLFVLAAFGFSSCNKCYECDFSPSGKTVVREICRKNFEGDKVLFEKTIEEYRKAGYKCVEK
ncbi:MAG: hypothetical protein RMJ53_05685 [Chitinophagales bacterium]|nr:hypothetical protein [Chitinophagales bacterium]MDW8273701.1 hypothetical protein [Chitinophagales bacterium]